MCSVACTHQLFFLTFFFFFIYVCMYVCMAVLGLRFCARAFSSCGKRGPLFIAVRGPLIAKHRLQTRRLSNRGSRAESLRGMWDPPRPGLEPASPASAGRLPTTAPPGKPHSNIFNHRFMISSRPLSNEKVFLFTYSRGLQYQHNPFFYYRLWYPHLG